MTLYGVPDFFANFMFTGLRLLIDQTAENATGVGALRGHGRGRNKWLMCCIRALLLL